MTERRGPSEPFEYFVDRLVREARERELDRLPRAGKPLPDLGDPHDVDVVVERWRRRRSGP